MKFNKYDEDHRIASAYCELMGIDPDSKIIVIDSGHRTEYYEWEAALKDVIKFKALLKAYKRESDESN